MINGLSSMSMAIKIATDQIYELVKPVGPVHDGCGCRGKRFPTDPACICAMKNYFKDGDDWYNVNVTIEKVDE